MKSTKRHILDCKALITDAPKSGPKILSHLSVSLKGIEGYENHFNKAFIVNQQ